MCRAVGSGGLRTLGCIGPARIQRRAAAPRRLGENAKWVQRIWRQAGLKVPQKQPKHGRLWLNHGLCMRLRDERPNHVWSYDFVEERTHDGRKFRMLCLIDEFTHEAFAIRVKHRLNSTGALETLADVMILRGPPPYVRADNGPEFMALALREWIGCRRFSNRPHRTRQPLGERLLRQLQQQAPRRTARGRSLLWCGRSPGSDRGLAGPLQQRAPSQFAGISTAGAGILRPPQWHDRAMGERASCWRRALAHPYHGVRSHSALTSKLNSPSRAGQGHAD